MRGNRLYSQKYKLTDNKCLEWAKQFPGVVVYLNQINRDREAHAQYLWFYCEWAKLNPEQLLKLKDDINCLDAERMLDAFVGTNKILLPSNEEGKLVELPTSQKWHTAVSVRGFFRVNYRDLRKQAGKMYYYGQKEQRCPKPDARRKLYHASYSLRNKSLILLSMTTAIARETMTLLKWSYLEDNWQKADLPYMLLPGEILKGRGLGKYHGTKQVAFLTPQTKQHLIEYREWFSRAFSYQWKDDDYIFLCEFKLLRKPMTLNAMSKIICSISRRAGVPFGIHDGRRILQTSMEAFGTSQNWIKKLKGRKPANEEAPYSKPAIEELRKKFREALPSLEFLEPDASELNDLKAQNEELIMSHRLAEARIGELEGAIKRLFSFVNERDSLERMAENSLRAEKGGKNKSAHSAPTARRRSQSS